MKQSMKRTILLVAALILACSSAYGGDSSDVEADTKPVTSDSDKWKFQLTPYLFLPRGLEGTSTVAGSTVGLKLDFSDIMENFDMFGFSARFEAWKGNWGLIFDGMYTDIDGDFRYINPILTKLELDIVQVNIDFAVSYRLCELAFREGENSPALSFALIGGGRYAYLKQKINPEIRSELTPKLGKSKDWVEPFVGGSIRLQLTEKFALGVRGDFGGFGIGSASNKTWNLLGGFLYRFSEGFELKVAYNIYDIDYDNGSGFEEFGFDAKMDGPKLGLTYHF